MVCQGQLTAWGAGPIRELDPDVLETSVRDQLGPALTIRIAEPAMFVRLNSRALRLGRSSARVRRIRARD